MSRALLPASLGVLLISGAAAQAAIAPAGVATVNPITAAGGDVGYRQFDPRLGRLDRVNLHAIDTLSGAVTYNTFEQRTGMVTSGGSRYIGQSIGGVSIGSATVGASGTAATAGVAPGGSRPGQIRFSQTKATDTWSPGNTPALAAVIGTGTVASRITTSAPSSTVRAPLNFDGAVRTQAARTSALSYTYTEGLTGTGDGGAVETRGVVSTTFNVAISGLRTGAQVRTVQQAVSGWDALLSFAQFDPSLGHLNGVYATVAGNLRLRGSVENLGAQSGTYDLTQSGTWTLHDTAGGDLVSYSQSRKVSGTLGAADGAIDFSGRSGASSTGAGDTTSTDRAGADVSDVTVLSPFIGTGTVSLRLENSGTLDLLTSLSDVVVGSRGFAGAVVSFGYIYDPVLFSDGAGTQGVPTRVFRTGVRLADPFARAVSDLNDAPDPDFMPFSLTPAQLTDVPEPTTAGVLAIGLVALLRRRRG